MLCPAQARQKQEGPRVVGEGGMVGTRKPSVRVAAPRNVGDSSESDGQRHVGQEKGRRQLLRCALGTVLGLPTTPAAGTVNPILQIKKLRLREAV